MAVAWFGVLVVGVARHTALRTADSRLTKAINCNCPFHATSLTTLPFTYPMKLSHWRTAEGELNRIWWKDNHCDEEGTEKRDAFNIWGF